MDSSFVLYSLLIAAVWGTCVSFIMMDVNHGNSCNKSNAKPNCKTTSTTTGRSTAATTLSPTVSTPSNPQTTEQKSTTFQSEEKKDTTATSAQSDVNAAYIAAPVVICVIALLLILGFIWWRKRKTGPSVWHKKGKTNSLILNVVNGENGTTGNGSSVDIRQSTVNEYTEIALDQMNPDKTTGDNYQTIDILAEDNVCANKSYSNVIQSDSKAINAKYSHIDINQTQKIKHSNNTYAHTRSANVSDKPEMEIEYEDDETYNRLNTTTLKTNKVKEDEDTEYNHAHSGAKDLENNQNESDNYSHLANGRKTPHESAKTSERIHAANGNIDSDIGQLSKSGIETPTDYELAKDFDNLKGSSEMPEFTNATKKTSDFNKMSAENNGNETDSGKDHNYSILEPEAATNAMSFHVVEDELDVTVEQMEGIKSHEYFILEKTNT